MTSPADESITDVKPVKLKQTRKKYAGAKPNDKRLKANQQRSEAQVAAQFKPGNAGGGPTTAKANTAKRNREFREKCYKILNEAAIPMLVNRLYDANENMDTKHFIELLKFLTLYGIGKPAEQEGEVEALDAKVINNIVISQEMLNQAMFNDNSHLADINVSPVVES